MILTMILTSENGRKNHFGSALETFANCTLSNGAYWRSRDAGHVAEKRLRQATFPQTQNRETPTER